MSGLQRFEQRLSGLVEGSFARLFRGKVEPVELASALAREADNNKAVGPQRVLVPNVYDIHLGGSDFERLAPYALTLGDELAAMVREHAGEQGYSFVGPVTVTLERHENLSTGSFRVDSRVEAGADAPARPVAVRPTPRPTPTPSPPPDQSALPQAPAAAPRSPPGPPAAPVDTDQSHTTVLRPVPPLRPVVHGYLCLPDGHRVPVTTTPLILGRGSDADVRLPDASVSRKHARVSVTGRSVGVEDLGSTNGTTLNGRKISREVLTIGDTLTLGAANVQFQD